MGIVDHWWGNANKVYNYVSANGDSFASVVDSAPDASFSPLFNMCGGADGALSADDLTNALTILDGFDTDKNGALTGDEINAYYAEAVRIANSWGYKVTDGQWAALKTAYGQYMADGRLSMVDLARF